MSRDQIGENRRVIRDSQIAADVPLVYGEAKPVDWASTRRQPVRPAGARSSTPSASADADRATSRGIIAVLLQYPARPMLRQSLIVRPFRTRLLV
jgi:hypothetical protein